MWIKIAGHSCRLVTHRRSSSTKKGKEKGKECRKAREKSEREFPYHGAFPYTVAHHLTRPAPRMSSNRQTKARSRRPPRSLIVCFQRSVRNSYPINNPWRRSRASPRTRAAARDPSNGSKRRVGRRADGRTDGDGERVLAGCAMGRRRSRTGCSRRKAAAASSYPGLP